MHIAINRLKTRAGTFATSIQGGSAGHLTALALNRESECGYGRKINERCSMCSAALRYRTEENYIKLSSKR
jgi:hypothetical protein